jgi:predicted nucleic acid-binding protein
MTAARGGRAALGLADTSMLIAIEQQRPLRGEPPLELAISVVTIGELRLGVLAAAGAATRARRLETLARALAVTPLPVDESVAGVWAALILALRSAGRRMPVNDSWIAATAIAHRIPVVAQDADYDEVPGLDVLRV